MKRSKQDIEYDRAVAQDDPSFGQEAVGIWEAILDAAREATADRLADPEHYGEMANEL